MKSAKTKRRSTKEQVSPDLAALTNLWERLEVKGLLQKKAASLSFRIPGQKPETFIMMDRGSEEGAKVRIDQFDIHGQTTTLGSERLAAIHFHASMYKARPDIGAIVCFQPAWASLLKTLKDPLPLVFDEQCRQLGAPVVPIHKSEDGSAIPDSVLLKGANAFLDTNGVVITSVTPEKAIYNCELIEKCSKAYLLARATGGKIRQIPWLIRWIAKNRLLKDERKAAAAYALGQAPTGFTAY